MSILAPPPQAKALIGCPGRKKVFSISVENHFISSHQDAVVMGYSWLKTELKMNIFYQEIQASYEFLKLLHIDNESMLVTPSTRSINNNIVRLIN